MGNRKATPITDPVVKPLSAGDRLTGQKAEISRLQSLLVKRENLTAKRDIVAKQDTGDIVVLFDKGDAQELCDKALKEYRDNRHYDGIGHPSFSRNLLDYMEGPFTLPLLPEVKLAIIGHYEREITKVEAELLRAGVTDFGENDG